jgi:hypothetical protein
MRDVVRQRGGEGLGQHDRGAQIGLEMQVPGLAGQGADAVVLEGRGAVDQQGDGADLSSLEPDQAPRHGFVGEVGADQDRAATQGPHGVGRLLASSAGPR